jgi:hypothetical protein
MTLTALRNLSASLEWEYSFVSKSYLAGIVNVNKALAKCLSTATMAVHKGMLMMKISNAVQNVGTV